MIYKAVFHIDMDDEKALSVGLANVTNLLLAIEDTPHKLVMLFNGPAVTMLTKEKLADFADNIKQLQAEQVEFQVCNNALTKFDISPDRLMDGFTVIPAGIVALIELQNRGYAYIKP